MSVVPSRVRSELFLQVVHLHLQPPDLLVQRRRQRLRIRRSAGLSPLERHRRIFQKLALPLRDLRRVDLVARRQLAQRMHPLDRLQRHLRLELLRMLVARLTHFMDSSADSVRGADPAGQPTESLLNTCPKNGGNFISPPTKNPLDEIVTSATFALVEMEREARSDVDTNSRSAKLYELWQVGTMRFVLHFTIALLFFFLLRFLSNWIAENILH